jgi:hypothetical protein
MLTIEQIREAQGPSFWMVPVPEWGGEVRARRLTAQDYLRFAEFPVSTQEERFQRLIELIRMLLTNDDGSPLMRDEDAYLLTEAPTLATRLGLELMRLNGLIRDDAKKNSPGTQT